MLTGEVAQIGLNQRIHIAGQTENGARQGALGATKANPDSGRRTGPWSLSLLKASSI